MMVKECEESVLKKLVKVCRWCIHTNMLSIEKKAVAKHSKCTCALNYESCK